MRAQIAGTGGYVIADLGDYGNAVDVGVRGPNGWMMVRLTRTAARKLSEALGTMAKPPKVARKHRTGR